MLELSYPYEKPSLKPHLLMHPDENSYVHFQHDPLAGTSLDLGESVMCHDLPGTQDGWVQVRELQQLESWIPELREQLLRSLSRDAYASINSGWRASGWPTANQLSRLNAVYVDCDCEDLDYLEAVSLLSQAQAEGLVPPVSMIQDSGRGIWAFWFLRGAEDNPELPPKSFRRNRVIHYDLNRALVRRLQRRYPELEVDPGSSHVARHHRVCGSVNSKTGNQVSFTIHLTGSGEPPRYTFEELRTHLEVPDPIAGIPRNKSYPNKKAPAKRRGWIARHDKPLGELADLWRFRRGIDQGQRRKACYFFSSLALGAGWNRGAVEAEVLEIARQSRPALPRSEALQQVRSAQKKIRRPANATIARELKITEQEISRLGLKKLRPDFDAPQGRRTGLRRAAREARLALLEALAKKYGDPLPFTYSELGKHLRESGLTTSRGTLVNDLRRLGKSVMGYRRRPSPQRSLIQNC